MSSSRSRSPSSAPWRSGRWRKSDWKPLHILNGIASSVGATLKPAGLENAKGIISDNSFKDPTDPQWLNDAGYKQWLAFMDKYYPNGDKTDNQTVYGYSIAQTTVQVLKQCGDDLTRENVMKQAANLHNFELPMLLPGIVINTSPTDFQLIKQAQMRRFNGERYVPFGPVLSGGGQLNGQAVATRSRPPTPRPLMLTRHPVGENCIHEDEGRRFSAPDDRSPPRRPHLPSGARAMHRRRAAPHRR